MAVTRINGQKRLLEKSIIESLLDDNAVIERVIADKAVTPSKVDSNGNYNFNKLTAKDAAELKSTAHIVGDATLDAKLSVGNDATVSGKLDVTGDGSFGGNVVISGDLQVDGNRIIANTSVMEVEDKNITVNKGGNTDSMTGSGLTVDNADSNGNKGSLIYDANAASKWKLGNEGAEVEVVDLTTAQTLEAKTYKLVGDAIESQNNVEDALRALDDKVNNGTAYKVQEGDTSSSNYVSDSQGNRWETGEAITEDTPVHVYVSGVRLRSGTKDSKGNISNDYAVDYANGKVEFSEEPDGNIIVEYIKAS